MTEEFESVPEPENTEDPDALREYGRQRAMDSILRDLFAAQQAEGQSKVVPLKRQQLRQIAFGVVAACIAGLLAATALFTSIKNSKQRIGLKKCRHTPHICFN